MSGDYIYYGDFGMKSPTHSIVKEKLDGSNKSVVVPSKVSISLWGMGGDWCYYADGRGTGVNLYKASLSDPTKIDIPVAQNLSIDKLAVANGKFYYIDFDRTVYKLDENISVFHPIFFNPTTDKLKEQDLGDLID